MRRLHCEDISSSTCVGTALLSFRVCATKKPCFAPPLASLYRVCGGRGTRNSQLNGNGTERYWTANGKKRNKTGNVFLTPTVYACVKIAFQLLSLDIFNICLFHSVIVRMQCHNYLSVDYCAISTGASFQLSSTRGCTISCDTLSDICLWTTPSDMYVCMYVCVSCSVTVMCINGRRMRKVCVSE